MHNKPLNYTKLINNTFHCLVVHGGRVYEYVMVYVHTYIHITKHSRVFVVPYLYTTYRCYIVTSSIYLHNSFAGYMCVYVSPVIRMQKCLIVFGFFVIYFCSFSYFIYLYVFKRFLNYYIIIFFV